MHVKSNHVDEERLAEAISAASLSEQVDNYLTRRYLEYLRWLEVAQPRISSSITRCGFRRLFSLHSCRR